MNSNLGDGETGRSAAGRIAQSHDLGRDDPVLQGIYLIN
jgi:hypothetical protein